MYNLKIKMYIIKCI